jgi:hypothetical protein
MHKETEEELNYIAIEHGYTPGRDGFPINQGDRRDAVEKGSFLINAEQKTDILDIVLSKEIRPFLAKYFPDLELITFTKNQNEWKVVYAYRNLFGNLVQGTMFYGGNPNLLPLHFELFLDADFEKNLRNRQVDDCTYLIKLILHDAYKEHTPHIQEFAINVSAMLIDINIQKEKL